MLCVSNLAAEQIHQMASIDCHSCTMKEGPMSDTLHVAMLIALFINPSSSHENRLHPAFA